jgi:aspartyl protease family protein
LGVGCLGYVRVKGTIANPLNRDLKLELEFLVDTGAIYTVISKNVAGEIKLKEVGKRKFKTGSGVVELPVAEAYLIFEGEGVTSLVAISSDDEMPILLGVTTLELLGLQVDPVMGKLKPLELLIL